jgi:hypothetical protein
MDMHVSPKKPYVQIGLFEKPTISMLFAISFPTY